MLQMRDSIHLDFDRNRDLLFDLLGGDQYLTAELAGPVDAKEDLMNRTARGMSSET